MRYKDQATTVLSFCIRFIKYLISLGENGDWYISLPPRIDS